MNGQITMQVNEENQVAIFVKNLEPYDSITVLLSAALALLQGNADVTFSDGDTLTAEEEKEILESLAGGVPPGTGGQRDN